MTDEYLSAVVNGNELRSYDNGRTWYKQDFIMACNSDAMEARRAAGLEGLPALRTHSDIGIPTAEQIGYPLRASPPLPAPEGGVDKDVERILKEWKRE